MPPSKANILETLNDVKNLGPAFAERAYDELGVRSLDDLIKAAEAGKLQSIKGVGAAKEKSILKSARELTQAGPKSTSAPKAKAEPKPTPKPSAPKKDKAPKKASTSDKKPAAKKAPAKAATTSTTKSAQTSAAKKSPAPKAPNPESDKAKSQPTSKAPATKPAAAREAAAANQEPKPSSSTNGARTERPRTTYRPPATSKSRPSIPGLIFKLGKKIIGRLLG